MTLTEQDPPVMCDLAPATVLLYDAQDVARRNTRQALADAGIVQVREISTSRELGYSLKERRHDLLVLASAHLDDGIASLLRNLRRHRFGLDPFAPVLVTVSSKDDRLVQRIAFSGVDHIVSRPFSNEQFARRLYALIGDRPRFIETLDYLGPDRRRDGRANDKNDSVEVPNALKSRIERRRDLAPTPENIGAAKSALAQLRTRNIGRQIEAAVKRMASQPDESGTNEETERELAMLNRCLDALDKSDMFDGNRAVGRACGGLRNAVSVFCTSSPDVRAQTHGDMITSASTLLEVLQLVRTPDIEAI